MGYMRLSPSSCLGITIVQSIVFLKLIKAQLLAMSIGLRNSSRLLTYGTGTALNKMGLSNANEDCRNLDATVICTIKLVTIKKIEIVRHRFAPESVKSKPKKSQLPRKELSKKRCGHEPILTE